MSSQTLRHGNPKVFGIFLEESSVGEIKRQARVPLGPSSATELAIDAARVALDLSRISAVANRQRTIGVPLSQAWKQKTVTDCGRVTRVGIPLREGRTVRGLHFLIIGESGEGELFVSAPNGLPENAASIFDKLRKALGAHGDPVDYPKLGLAAMAAFPDIDVVVSEILPADDPKGISTPVFVIKDGRVRAFCDAAIVPGSEEIQLSCRKCDDWWVG